jgi:hypothetical protein
LRLLAAVFLAFAAAGSARAQIPLREQRNAEMLEKLAHQEFGELSAAERTFVRGAASREVRWVGPSDDPADPSNDPDQPGKWGAERAIRAELFAWLVSASETAPFIHPSGPGIAGAKIIGKLDLSYANVARPLTLIRCAIPEGVDFSNATLAGIEFRHCGTGAIMGDSSHINGDLALHFGHYGALSIFRTNISGDFDCSGANFTGSGATDTISAQESVIGGDATFVQDFTTDGVVYMRLARIGRSLGFNHAHFIGKGDTGLDAQRAVIAGGLYWDNIEHTAQTMLDLENASVTSLFDDSASWPAAGKLNLDGFTYSEFGGGSPADAVSRLQWLGLQPGGYRPQPYTELSRALKQTGRTEGEIEVLIAQRIAQRRNGNLTFAGRAWNLLLQATIGYGYRPLRALWWIAGFVFFGAMLFAYGYRAGIMMPSELEAYQAFTSGGRPTVHYPHFNAFVYSLENFLPVVDLHMGNYWRPNVREQVVVDPKSGEWMTKNAGYAGRLLRWYLWFHILAGWTLTPLMFAGLSGLIRVE